jgi:hypothetical protein
VIDITFPLDYDKKYHYKKFCCEDYYINKLQFEPVHSKIYNINYDNKSIVCNLDNDQTLHSLIYYSKSRVFTLRLDKTKIQEYHNLDNKYDITFSDRAYFTDIIAVKLHQICKDLSYMYKKEYLCILSLDLLNKDIQTYLLHIFINVCI